MKTHLYSPIRMRTKRIVIENLRSAYNVGNIIRTADALGRGVVFVGYTARHDHPKVQKTALGAQDAVRHIQFEDLSKALCYMHSHGIIIAAELDEKSIPLTDLHERLDSMIKADDDIFLIVGNEVTGVEQETLRSSHIITHIPMLGNKESLNVGQAAAIIMRELS